MKKTLCRAKGLMQKVEQKSSEFQKFQTVESWVI